MKQFFEYIYYRMAKLHPMKDYHEGTLSLTISQTLIVVNLYFLTIMGPLDIKRKLLPIEYIAYFAIFLA